MEWDLKMPPWDVAGLEREADLSVGMAPPDNRLDCSVDLKLGGFGDLGPVKSRWEHQPRAPPPPSTSVMPSSGTLKRPRALSISAQGAPCSVDGCDADLSKCREYHRRHKVCEVHSKTPAVMVGGREQRFCQQCSRFHSLIEFDEVKRSCRKRLDGHNRRRRKPQPNSLNSGNLFPSHQGSMFSVSPQLFPVTTTEQHWAGVSKSEEILYRQCASPQLIERGLCFANSYICNKEGKQFPFLQNNRSMLGTGQIPLLTTISLSGRSNSNGSGEMFSHGATPVFRSDCALSLLSSPTQTSGINIISHILPPAPADRIPMSQPFASNSQNAESAHRPPPETGFPCPPVMEDGAIFVSDENAPGTLQMLPFSWN